MVLKFTTSVILELPISQGTRVGIETFAKTSTIHFLPQDYASKSALLINALDLPYYKGGITNTADALKKLRTMLTSGGTTGARRVAFIITDGRSIDMDQTMEEARINKANNISQVAVGVGDSVRFNELLAIASYPATGNVFNVSHFSRLKNFKDSFLDTICNRKY